MHRLKKLLFFFLNIFLTSSLFLFFSACDILQAIVENQAFTENSSMENPSLEDNSTASPPSQNNSENQETPPEQQDPSSKPALPEDEQPSGEPTPPEEEEPNGKPTPQMTAMGEVFRAVAPLKDFIIKKKFSDFPVFFTRDAKLNITTYEIEGAKRYGIVVNRNTKENRTVTVYLPLNVSSVRDMISGKSYTLKNSGKYFKEISFELSAGGGTVLEADFVSEYVGMPVCHETFDQYSYHRVALTDNGKVATYGEFRIEDNRAVCSKGDADKPVCILKNLSGKKSANNTFSLNINTVKKAANGTLFCMLEGRLLNDTIKAVHDDIASVKSNFLHLREDTVESKKADDKAVKSVTISKNPVNGEAFVIPPGTTALEFYIGDNKSLIDDIYVWFVPNKK